nr:hypothetical protein HmN_000177100 [Hymenolepis microstoma]
MALNFGKLTILVGAGLNALILAGALAGGIYLIVTECVHEENYNNLCKFGAALTWLGTLAFVGLILFIVFGCIIIKLEKEIEALTTKKELSSNSDHVQTPFKAAVSTGTDSLIASSTTSFDEIRTKVVPLTARSNIPPKVEDFGTAASLLRMLNQEQSSY